MPSGSRRLREGLFGNGRTLRRVSPDRGRGDGEPNARHRLRNADLAPRGIGRFHSVNPKGDGVGKHLGKVTKGGDAESERSLAPAIVGGDGNSEESLDLPFGDGVLLDEGADPRLIEVDVGNLRPFEDAQEKGMDLFEDCQTGAQSGAGGAMARIRFDGNGHPNGIIAGDFVEWRVMISGARR